MNEAFAPYLKMKKLRMPDGAIRQKMLTDGMSDTDIAAFFEGAAVAQGAGSAAAAAAPPPPKTAGRSALLGQIAARRQD